MVTTTKLNEALHMVEQLPNEDFLALMDILRTRENERWREDLGKSADEAQLAYERGELRPTTVAELMQEARK